MKNLLTTKQLRSKYDPDTVLRDIDSSYEKNIEKIKSCVAHRDSPIHNYNIVQQLSLLETDPNEHHSHLVNDLLFTLNGFLKLRGTS